MDGKVHFIFKCKICKRITGTCRCPAKEKPIRWIDSCSICTMEAKEKK